MFLQVLAKDPNKIYKVQLAIAFSLPFHFQMKFFAFRRLVSWLTVSALEVLYSR